MATKINPGKFDCYSNAEPDEPMFTLLARDRHAPALVRTWADIREKAGENKDKVAEARQCAIDMESWRSKHRPPMPFGQSFEGGVLSVFQVQLESTGTMRIELPGVPLTDKQKREIATELRDLADTVEDLP